MHALFHLCKCCVPKTAFSLKRPAVWAFRPFTHPLFRPFEFLFVSLSLRGIKAGLSRPRL